MPESSVAIRIAVDRDCPDCGYPELSGAMPGDEESPLLLCRKCGWKQEAHEHSWQLTEEGYIRQWDTEIEEDGTIIATYSGASDWSEEGDGNLYLECLQCMARKPIEDESVVDWQ